MRLLALLLEKHRQSLIPDIADQYTEATDRVRGVEKAEITVATHISSDTEKILLDAIQRFSTREVQVSIHVDPRILGGVIIRLGDRVIDGSLRRRFEEIRRTMLAARLPKRTLEEST